MAVQSPLTPTAAKISLPQRNVKTVAFGDLLIKTWYRSSYPEELVGKGTVDKLYVCKWCFKYTVELTSFRAHERSCGTKGGAPPGRIIYSRDNYAIYEVDGEDEQLFSQNLSLFSKLFLDTKSIFFDVTTFTYYILLLSDGPGFTPETWPPRKNRSVIGFFSKEKMSWDNNNLACILVFPPWQRLGYGSILMGISYHLAEQEGRYGGPEKPLSEMGRKGYEKFWAQRVARQILSGTGKKGKLLTVKELGTLCWMLPEDVLVALKLMGLDDMDERRKDGSVVVGKDKVKAWVQAGRVDLEPPIKEEEFYVWESEEDDMEEDE